MVWIALGLPAPTELQYDMANELQKSSSNIILQAFRGAAKTHVTCAYVAWLIWHNVDIHAIVISANSTKARENLYLIKRIIQSPILSFLNQFDPDTSDLSTQDRFRVPGAKISPFPTVRVAGVLSMITGARATVIIPDDIETVQNSDTPAKRESIMNVVREFTSILEPGGRTIALGTPQTNASIYNIMRDSMGYRTIIWPFLYPNKSETTKYNGCLAPYITSKQTIDPTLVGKCTEPLRFSSAEVEKRKLTGKSYFKLQYMLDTSLSSVEMYPLKASDLIVSDLDIDRSSTVWSWSRNDPCSDITAHGVGEDIYYYREQTRSNDIMPYISIVMAIDPSGRGRDETAFAIVAFLNGFIFVLESGGFSSTTGDSVGYSDDVMKQLAVKAKFYNVHTVLVESNFGSGMFTQMLRPVMAKTHPCDVLDVTSSGQKEKRIISTLEPVMMSHRLIVNKNVVLQDEVIYQIDASKSLFYQLTHLTTERGSLAHDDRLDALQMAVRYLIPCMDKDVEKGADDFNCFLLDIAQAYGILSQEYQAAVNGKLPKEYNGRSTGLNALDRWRQ